MALHAAVAALEAAVHQATTQRDARVAAAAWVVHCTEDPKPLLEAQEFAWFEEFMPLLGGMVPRKNKNAEAGARAFLTHIDDEVKAKRSERSTWCVNY